MTEVFRVNTDRSVTVFEASLEQYQEAIKMLIDWKDDEIERLREALQLVANSGETFAEWLSAVSIARSALQQKESE